jgi:hypothetical protein
VPAIRSNHFYIMVGYPVRTGLIRLTVDLLKETRQRCLARHRLSIVRHRIYEEVIPAARYPDWDYTAETGCRSSASIPPRPTSGYSVGFAGWRVERLAMETTGTDGPLAPSRNEPACSSGCGRGSPPPTEIAPGRTGTAGSRANRDRPYYEQVSRAFDQAARNYDELYQSNSIMAWMRAES